MWDVKFLSNLTQGNLLSKDSSDVVYALVQYFYYESGPREHDPCYECDFAVKVLQVYSSPFLANIARKILGKEESIVPGKWPIHEWKVAVYRAQLFVEWGELFVHDTVDFYAQP